MSDLKTNLQEILQEKQDKIIPENIKKDVQIFDVTGTYEGSGSSTGGEVKLFETEEEMQADSTAKEGDLAVVYREEIQNMTVDTQTQYITFPETVVLPEAVTSSYNCMLRAVDNSAMFDGRIRLSAAYFSFEGYSDTGMITVRYTSTDGINYTRETSITNPVDLGTSVGVYRSDGWNDNFGYFMQIGGMTFDGLFEYKLNNINEDIFHFISLPSITFDFNAEETDQITNLSYEYSDNQYSMTKVNVCLNKMHQDGLFKNTVSGFVYEGIDGNLYAYNAGGSIFSQYIGYDDEKTLLGLIKSGKTEIITYKLDLENGTYEQADTITFGDNTLKYSSTTYNVSNPNNMNSIPIRYALVSHTITPNNTSFNVFCGNSTVAYTQNESNIDCRIVENTYTYATTQYTLNAPNQLLPNVIAYGKNGNVMGDGTIWNEIPEQVFYKNILGYDVPSNQYGNIRRSTSLPNNKVLYGNFDKSAENYIRILRFDDGTYPIKTHTDFGAYAYQKYDADYYMSQCVAASDKYTYSIGINRQESQAWIYRYDVVNKTIEEKIVPEDIKDAIMTPTASRVYDVYQTDMYIAIHKDEVLTLYKYNFDSNVFTSVYTEALRDEYSEFLTIQCTPNGKVAIACTNSTGERINYISYDIASNTSKKVLDNFTQSNSARTVRISYVMDKKHLVIACDPGGFILNTDEETYDRVNIASDAIPAATMCINNRLFPLDLDTSRNLTYYDLTTKEFTKTDVVISASYRTLQFVGYTDEGIVYNSSAGVMWVTDTSMEIYSKDVDSTNQGDYQTSESDRYYGMNYSSNCYAIEKFDNYMRFDTCGIDGNYHDYFGFANWYAGNINIVDPTTDADVIFGSNFEISSNLPEKADISMKEYNAALDTSEQILGEGETVNE